MKIIGSQMQMCLSCMEEHEVQMVEVEQSNSINGEIVSFDAIYYYCKDTDELYQTEELIRNNDIKFKNAYRKKVHLLTSDEIVAIRERYYVSQKDFSIILKWGLSTITRYETYQVQDSVHNDMLKKIGDDPEWFLELLERSEKELSIKAYKKYHLRVEELLKMKAEEHLKKLIYLQYMDISINGILTGEVPLDLDKVVEVVNILAQNVDFLYKVKLMKMLWYSDQLSYKRYGNSITGLAYKALPMGAVPECYNEILLLKDIYFEEEIINGDIAYHFKPISDFKIKNLNQQEMDVIYDVIRQFKDMNSSQIVSTMHDEKAYKNTQKYQFISYKYADLLSIS